LLAKTANNSKRVGKNYGKICMKNKRPTNTGMTTKALIMTSYGNVAIAVVNEYNESRCADLKGAWEHQRVKLKAAKKPCPKSAFLGLCEAGRIRGIDAGNYGAPRNSPNTQYAIVATILIFSGQHFATKKEFWQCVRTHVPDAAENDQGTLGMVEDLYIAGYLK
jgi:hypothetical protein